MLTRTTPATARGRRPRCNRRWDAEVFSELIDLALVQGSDRLRIGEPIAALHEEALVIFETIRRAEHRVVQAVGVIVLEHRASTLFEIRSRNDLTIFRRGQSHLAHLSARRLHHQVGDVDAIAFKPIPRHDQLAAPIVAELGNHSTDRFVATLIAARAIEHRRDILDNALDAELGSVGLRQRQAFRVALPLREKQPENMFGAHRTHCQRGANRAVDSPAHADDETAALECLAELPAKCVRDSRGFCGRIDIE